ncbi:unnamed protein product [Periconia digitata]|uniref:Peptidase A1 domain-containing protein n=1 Tax=Periconia digitata TaxID=1303443 RepID=A0A9W4UBI9_9PLEO|nr:unnamed protein product [Periconia digitata]
MLQCYRYISLKPHARDWPAWCNHCIRFSIYSFAPMRILADMIAMILGSVFTHVLAFATHINALEQRTPSRVAIASHVLPLIAAPYTHPQAIPPSSRYLRKRYSRYPTRIPANPMLSHENRDPISDIQSDVETLGGRIYMTNISVGSHEYSVIIDTGSSDTWVAASNFACVSRFTTSQISQDKCGFGILYDKNQSDTFVGIPSHRFGTSYTDGEFLSGELGSEVLGIGGENEDMLKVRQTIGVVERGYWNGDGISSGLMGLAYSALVSHGKELGYKSLIFTLFENTTTPAVFSIALSRPTIESPVAGGLLAIGGLPNVDHDGEFVSVDIKPLYAKNYALYAIDVDGFDVQPPISNISLSSTTNSDSPDIISTTLPVSTTPFPTFSSQARLQSHAPNSTTRSSRSRHLKSKPSKHSPSPSPRINPRQAIRPSNADPNSTIIFTPNLTMVIDSGTTLLYVPEDIAERIASLFVPRAIFSVNTNTYLVPCSALAPRVGVVVAGRSFYIHPDDLMNRAPGAVGGGGKVWVTEDGTSIDFEDSGSSRVEGEVGRGLCTLAVQRQGLGDAVLGDSWLKNVLAVFDVGANEMRFSGRENY